MRCSVSWNLRARIWCVFLLKFSSSYHKVKAKQIFFYYTYKPIENIIISWVKFPRPYHYQGQLIKPSNATGGQTEKFKRSCALQTSLHASSGVSLLQDQSSRMRLVVCAAALAAGGRCNRPYKNECAAAAEESTRWFRKGKITPIQPT